MYAWINSFWFEPVTKALMVCCRTIKHWQASMTVQQKSLSCSFLYLFFPLLYRPRGAFLYLITELHHPVLTIWNDKWPQKHSALLLKANDKVEAADLPKLLIRKSCQNGNMWVRAKAEMILPITCHILYFGPQKKRKKKRKTIRKNKPMPILRRQSSSHDYILSPFTFKMQVYLLWPAAQTQGCHHWLWAQSHFHLSGWLHIAGLDLQVGQTAQREKIQYSCKSQELA